MPYIKKPRREIYKESLKDLQIDLEHAPLGDFTYIIYKLMLGYIGKKPSYTECAAVIASTETAKLEFYRKVLAKLEDKKIIENGDIS